MRVRAERFPTSPSFPRKQESSFFSSFLLRVSASPREPALPFVRAETRRRREEKLDFRLRGNDGKRLAALTAALLLAAPAAAQPKPPTAHDRAIAAGFKALFLCSGLFNAGRTQAQVEAEELTGIYTDLQPIVTSLSAQIDRPTATVTVAFDDALPPRRASWRPGFGCTIAPIGAPPPPIVASYGEGPPPPAALDPRPWPMGDKGGTLRRAPAALAPVLARLFDPNGYGKGVRTTSAMVLIDDRIAAERYADGFGPTVSQRTWSAAKSMTGTIVGIAQQQGILSADEPARVPEWRADDPRRAIRIDDLIRMASGLYNDPTGGRTDAMYFGGTAVTERATSWPMIAKPGTRFYYANNDMLLAIRSLRAALADDARYSAFPRTQLFDRIGMRHTVAETDWEGNFMLSSQVWTTARDLARFGLLYLRDGVWNGERLLPEGWVRDVATPSGPQPPGDGAGYGASFWLYGPKQGLPAGSFAAQGSRGQYVMVVPARKLVIVRQALDPMTAGFDLARFTADVIAAME